MRINGWLFALLVLPMLTTGRQVDSLKSLLAIAQKTKQPERAASFMSHIGYYYYTHQQYDSALHYYKSSLSVSNRKPDPLLDASSLNSMGALYSRKAFPDSSIYYYKKALNLYHQLKDTVNATSLEINLSIIYKEIGQYEKALEAGFDAMTRLEQRKHDIPLTVCYNTVGSIYVKLKDYTNALAYFSKELQVSDEIKYSEGLGQSYTNKGEIFIRLRKYDSALYNLKQAEKIKRQQQDQNALGSTLNLIGEIYLDLHQWALADNYFNEAFVIKTASGERTNQVVILRNKAKLQIALLNYKAASQLLSQAEILARETGVLDYIRQILEQKLILYKALKDNTKAYTVAEELMLIKDSLLNKDKAESLIALQTRYETEKKEQHIKLLEQDKLVQQAEIKSKQSWIATLIITIVFVIVIALLLFMGYRISQRNRHKVEMLLKELHHRVKNNLQILSSILSLQSLHLTDADAIQAIKSSESRVNTMALIHKKLYKDESNRTIDIHEYITELSSFLLHSYGYNSQTLQLNITGEGIHIDVDKAIPIGLILNELISNALKYAYPEQANPRLDIHFQLLPSTELKIELRDNGKGMVTSETDDGTGSFGLKMVNTLIKELKGKITVAVQSGTAYTLQLPLHHG